MLPVHWVRLHVLVEACSFQMWSNLYTAAPSQKASSSAAPTSRIGPVVDAGLQATRTSMTLHWEQRAVVLLWHAASQSKT